MRLLSLISFSLGTLALHAAESPRSESLFNEDWKFIKQDSPDVGDSLNDKTLKAAMLASAEDAPSSTPPASAGPGEKLAFVNPAYDDSSWRPLTLPHDWGIEGTFDQKLEGSTGKLPWAGIGWYRKSFDLPAVSPDTRFSLRVDGAMSYSAVWLNGHFIGGWPYGYTSYQLDLTPHLKPGKNTLAIRLDNKRESSRWYPGGGIYRNLWLIRTGPIHIAPHGIRITTPDVTAASATVRIAARVIRPQNTKTLVEAAIYEAGPDGKRRGKPVATTRLTPATAAEAEATATLKIPRPKRWSTTSPSLYIAVTRVATAAGIQDEVETTFGIRTLEFTADRGFLLNGERVPIRGVCQHHDLGALGTAINTRALERQIQILKEMGTNAVRCSHNPPAPEFLDLCDRMGILVMDEFADCWKLGKTRNGYNVLFDQWAEKDVRAMVRRDRNHPSVILWSIGNEIREQVSKDGAAAARRLTEFVKSEDPTRLTTLGANAAASGYNGFLKGYDVFGYNYKPQEYPKFRIANPAVPLLGSETSSTISSRGEYFFPVSEKKDQGLADYQVSSYDLYAPRWATTPDDEFKAQDQNPSVAGEFVWTGFDYIGEPTPYNDDSTNLLNYSDPAEKERAAKELADLGTIAVPSRSSYFGIIDLAGFPKDRYFLYQSRWRPDFPMAHILPHWNWSGREGEVTPVHVYTSGDEAELFLNGRSLGRRKKAEFEYRLRWDDVRYEPGELKVVTYRHGKLWANASVKTTGPAAKLIATADRTRPTADGTDLSFITLTIADANGAPVPRSKNLVKFEIEGPGEIIATDNGDATSHVAFSSHQRAAFNGLCLAIIRPLAGKPGTLRIRATSEGLAPAEITLQSTR